jgi:serine/threonine-protein kinase
VIGAVLEEKYRVLEKLGSGGMGEVFLAETVEQGERLALKLLHRFLTRDAGFMSRFRREASAIGRLKHPNIVAVREAGVLEGGRPYLAMELVDGESVAARLLRLGRQPAAFVVALLDELAAAIAHAHAQGVMHRDLKPDNLMLRPRPGGGEQLVVLDFGMAKIIAPDHRESLGPTPLGDFFGMGPYTAPELVGGAGDARCDLYAIGCVGYELVTGATPFSGGPVDVLHRHLTMSPVPPRARCPAAEIPIALEAILLRCMEKDPARRFANGDELRRALAAL